ncbi:MAG: TIGR04076 family protein [Candidatus Bathyarchaeia archaeon]
MLKQACTLIVEVVDIQGYCPVYQVGERFCIKEGYKLVSDRPVCMHGLQAVCPYYIPLSRGIAPTDLGLAGPNGAAYVQCLDPQRYTGGGTVTFRITPKEEV